MSPKACAEEIGYTFLPCVLAYLHRAPSIVVDHEASVADTAMIRADDVDAVVVPVRNNLHIVLFVVAPIIVISHVFVSIMRWVVRPSSHFYDAIHVPR